MSDNIKNDAVNEKDDAGPTFEQGIQRLEEIIRMLESDGLSLAQGMALYKEGALQIRLCREKLEQARIELEIWQNGETMPVDSPDQL